MNMLDKYSDNDRLELKNQSEVIYLEVTTGIYYILKNRFGESNIYTTFGEIVKTLNRNSESVTIFGINETYSNIDLQ